MTALEQRLNAWLGMKEGSTYWIDLIQKGVIDLPNVRAKIRTGFSMGIKCISFVCYYPDGETFSIDIQDQSCINEYETIKLNIYG